jgi:hypothetical protein
MRTAAGLPNDTTQASRNRDFKTLGFDRRSQGTVPMMARKTIRDLPGAPGGTFEDKDPNDTRKEGGAEDTDFGHRKE